MRTRRWAVLGLLTTILGGPSRADDPRPLPGTRPLTLQGDIAEQLVAGVDRFLLRKTAESVKHRARFWKRDTSSPEAYNASVEPNRQRLAHILGVRDPRVSPVVPEITRPASFLSPQTAVSQSSAIHTLRWPAFGDVTGEGLILQPDPSENKGARPFEASVIVIPDAGQSPEDLAGLTDKLPPESQVALRLAEWGCRVIVPALIDRSVAPRNGRAKLTNREFLQRPAYELGRTLAGYEVQKVLALVDWLEPEEKHFAQREMVDPLAEVGNQPAPAPRVGVFGYGEGGLIALYAAALDPRIRAVCVSGTFDDRLGIWREPVDRNIFGLLDQFGGAELASLVAPRVLIIEAARRPEITIPPDTGGAPGRLAQVPLDAIKAEFERARGLVRGLSPEPKLQLVISDDGNGPFGTEPALRAFLAAFAPRPRVPIIPPEPPRVDDPPKAQRDTLRGAINARQARQVHEIDRHNQRLLIESPYVRARFMKTLDTSSPEAFRKSAEDYRRIFRDEVIGRFDDALLPPDVRSRRVFDEPTFTGYEVVMDVFPDVIAHGILLVPQGIKDGERRPVVVCQHGLEGRPRDVADPSVKNPAYNQFAVQLAERGFVTFAPQNLYIGHDRFRTLQRKANPLGKTLFSVIVPQHQQITDWLKTLPFVDPGRIGFYGLSYGGKSAMRIPPLVENYCLSICSGDFNEWVWKNASTRSPYSYVWTGEYEIFEWDLGSTFNYAEMAALIAPRPFMVERGHFDGVAPDEMVAAEFAKVRLLYEAKLGLGDRCAIEWFNGPHTIHGVGSFRFLHHHLNWPEPPSE